MVALKDVQVDYEGGSKQTINIDTPLSSSTGESKVFELNSGEKSVKKISFAYTPSDKNRDSHNTNVRSQGSKDTTAVLGNSQEIQGTLNSSQASKSLKAKIEVWGLKSNTALK